MLVIPGKSLVRGSVDMSYQVSFPGNFDDYEWAVIEAKGWLDGVRIVRDGDTFTLAIFDEVRLPQACSTTSPHSPATPPPWPDTRWTS